jgi:DNA-binding MarR family transcriptional regulator
MADKTSVAARYSAPGAASDTTLETSRLLVEFLHAAYATRRTADFDGDDSAKGSAHHAAGSSDVSSHAVRAAIHIYQHGERTVGQLASGLGISYGWASRVVEELENAGYAIRERDADDRRVVRVRLNPDKIGEVERAYQWRGTTVAAALEPLAAQEREAVRIFLRRLNSLLREEEPAQH